MGRERLVDKKVLTFDVLCSSCVSMAQCDGVVKNSFKVSVTLSEKHLFCTRLTDFHVEDV